MTWIRRAATAALVLTLAAAPAALAGRGVNIKGSDTMVILTQRWAEEYMNTHPGEIIEVTGGGSGTGIAALINGTTQVCMASRPMRDDEKKKLRDRYQTMGVEIPVARDGLSVYVSESNPIRELTLEQLRGIYLGELTNWKQVGGRDAIIVLYSRENSSGTYVYFKDHVLGGKDYSSRCQNLPGTAAVVNAVVKDPNGIGYGGAAYARGVREVAIRATPETPGVVATTETIRDGSYPIARHLYFYTRTKPSGDVKAFIDWVLSEPGQALVEKVGYFRLR